MQRCTLLLIQLWKFTWDKFCAMKVVKFIYLFQLLVLIQVEKYFLCVARCKIYAACFQSVITNFEKTKYQWHNNFFFVFDTTFKHDVIKKSLRPNSITKHIICPLFGLLARPSWPHPSSSQEKINFRFLLQMIFFLVRFQEDFLKISWAWNIYTRWSISFLYTLSGSCDRINARIEQI